MDDRDDIRDPPGTTGAANEFAAVPAALSLRAVVSKATGLSAVSLMGSALAVPVSFLVARWLGPGPYGETQLVLLFYFYATLLRTGTFEGGVRTYIDLRARGDRDEACRVRDVAISAESCIAILPGLAMAGLAAFQAGHLRQLGFALAPVAVVLSSVASYFGALYMADDQFGLVARTNLVRASFVPTLLVFGVPTIGPAAVFVVPIVGDATVVLIFSTRRPGLGLRARFDVVTWRRLIRIGFPFGAVAVVYWVYRTIGSASVAIARPKYDFGLYAFAAAPVGVITGAVAAIHGVLTPAVWTAMGAEEENPDWVRQAQRVTILLAVVAGTLTNVSQAGFGPIVRAVLPQFAGSIPVFDVLAGNIFLLTIGAIPALVLISARVNRQSIYLQVWLVALLLNVAANAVVLSLGIGSVAVAVNDLWIQVVVEGVICALAWRHLNDHAGWTRTVVLTVVLASITAGLGAVLHFTQGPGSVFYLVVVAMSRAFVVGACWGPIALVLRRKSQL